jgi:2-polyprenyl-6-methoxyphenol hydroxylase-like FAD-dependent oxidoreductase
MEAEQPVAAGQKIIVVGGGIAGLGFAISLRKQWPAASPFPEIVIYERDSSREASIGREGYSISIRGDPASGGMQALEKMGLLDTALKVAVSEAGPSRSSGFGFWDLQWNRLLSLGGQPGIRIARNALRQILVDAALDVPGVRIQWATTCGQVKVSDGRATVILPDGDVDEADILVASDGANSKVRASLRPDGKLSYAGAVL